MTVETIFSNTTEINLSQASAPDLFLTLEGETGNANDLGYIYHSAPASNDSGSAFGRGLVDTELTTRNLSTIDLYVTAHAINGANFAYGFDNILLESERNNNGINLFFDVDGSTGLSVDPTFGDTPIEEVDPDPSFGFENSTSYLTEFDDNVYIPVTAEARDFSNQAVAYGMRGGNSKVDKLSFDEVVSGSNLRGLRPTLMTYEGDDIVYLEVTASNNGDVYSVPNSADAVAGKQRAVGLFQAVVDLGDGNDDLQIDTFTQIGSGSFEKGAQSLNGASDFFGGNSSTEQTRSAAAAVDVYESAIFWHSK